VAEGSPTVRRRELGRLLRSYREANGLSVKEVTEHLMCSSSKISRLETGERGATLRDIRDLCNLYGITGKQDRDHLATLAREGKQQSPWQSVDITYHQYVDFEAEASSIKQYQSSIVPGLLQVAGYARALQTDVVPPLSAEVVEERVKARLERQLLLFEQSGAPAYSVILDESVLHRRVGGPLVMANQLEHLTEMADLHNVDIRVIPFDAGSHQGLESNFRILELKPPLHGLVYAEGLVGSTYLEGPDDIDKFQQIFQRLQRVALGQTASRMLVAELSRGMKRLLS
jgi:transcriptional regulator with XRE-family HTH domain